MTEIKQVTEVSEEDVQEFFDSESNPRNDDGEPFKDTDASPQINVDDDIPALPTPGHFDLSSASRPFIADDTSRVLSEEENRVLDHKIDRLIAAIADGRQLDLEQDPEIGTVDISATRQDEDYDLDSLEGHIADHPENFGNTIPSGSRGRMLRSDTSVVTVDPASAATSGTNAWERAIAAANIRYALRALSPISAVHHRRKAGRGVNSVDEIAQEDRGRYLIYMGKTDSEVCQIDPIPLNFAQTRGRKTPSIRSNGSELDRSSPLFEKSAEAWLRKSHSGFYSTSSHTSSPPKSRLREFISTWLDSIQSPSCIAIPKSPHRPERAFGVFEDDGDTSGRLASKQDTSRDNPAAKALKDISNLRRPGYLGHNSFAAPTLSSAAKGRALPSRSPAKPFGGAVDSESRRQFIESRWPGLLSRDKTSTGEKMIGASRLTQRGNEELQETGPTDDDKSMAYPPLHPDPSRAAHFEQALARIEGRAPPGQYSPPKRYPEEDYGSSVEVEHRTRRIQEPKRGRPVAKLAEQVVVGESFEDGRSADWEDIGEEEIVIGLEKSCKG
ncbi:hypothetical protein P7C71_g1692, partial [Lecanoromycetidae sp. Uapishka_2]